MCTHLTPFPPPERSPPSPSPPSSSPDTHSNPEWVRVLTEECKELRESNFQLRLEADMLRKETADIEQKEKSLVQQCLVRWPFAGD